MMSVMMTTFIWLSPMMSCTAGMVRRPSMAVVMVTAGVRMPSASRAAPPSMAGMMSHLPYLRTMLYRAKMPPSPWLSALRETSTYFTVVSSVTVQMTSERAPRMNSSVTVMMPPCPASSALVTYMGDVPMSPYTTPSVTSIAPMLTGIACEPCSAAVDSVACAIAVLLLGECDPARACARDRREACACHLTFKQL